MPNANNQTITSKKQVIYSDFADNFDKAPFSNDLARVTNENSVKQSIRNIVKTKLGSRLYDNTIGSSLGDQMFELDDSLFSSIAVKSITDALTFNEKRAQILQVTVNNMQDQNAFIVAVYFMVTNNPNVLTTTVTLDRVR